jgi:hypothetical protein
MSSRYTYCESAPSGPFFGQQGRKLAPEDATAVVVVEKFGAVMCRASIFRGNGAGSAAHYFVGTGAWGTEQSDEGRVLSFHG